MFLNDNLDNGYDCINRNILMLYYNFTLPHLAFSTYCFITIIAIIAKAFLHTLRWVELYKFIIFTLIASFAFIWEMMNIFISR